MSSKTAAVSVRNLSKCYTIAHNAAKHTTAAEALVHRMKNPLARPETEAFWALKDVSFDIEPGDVVGIIGRNGAGKSTLLKVLSRITEPTSGEAVLRGRVGSLLEVGTGFHPELTGRENVYLNGAILGMTRREIERQFDAIVDFSGTEKFLDTPVKRYSSGMYVRLAFAVAAHLEPEILIVDEVLAVGDAEFQKKCMGKMKDVANHGRTILFVSHNMTAVQSLCTRCILLNRGGVEYDGNTSDATFRYFTGEGQAGTALHTGDYHFNGRNNHHLPDGKSLIEGIRFEDDRGQLSPEILVGSPLRVRIKVRGLSLFHNPLIGIRFKTEDNQRLIGFNTAMSPPVVVNDRVDEEEVVLNIPSFPLTPGIYWLDVGIDEPGVRPLDYLEKVARLRVLEYDYYGTGFPVLSGDGVLVLTADWEINPAPSSVMTTSMRGSFG